MAIFNSYVKLPEGTGWAPKIAKLVYEAYEYYPPQTIEFSLVSQLNAILGAPYCMKLGYLLGNHYPETPALFPQTVCPRKGILTVGVKARCSIEVVAGACGIFPVNFHTK